jgi:succinoglycan biosynthesis transport protein ExoP
MNAVAAAHGIASHDELRHKVRSYFRQWRAVAIVVGGLLVISTLLALLLPPTYKSSATILIEQQEIPQDLVRSAITSFADQRIQIISQRVMTTQNLLQLIERYNLYPDIRKSKPREELIQRMRDDIAMKMISADVIDPRSGSPTRATIAFTVSYQNHSPDLALKVANEITTLYLNENLSNRSHLAEQTSAFFSEQAVNQQAQIAELDKTLAIFKEKHREELPELSQLNIQVSDRTELELRDVENRLSALDSQRILLEAQLAQISPTALVFSDTGQRVMNTEDRLKNLKSQLAGYKARYAPDHPDVVSTQREVDGLEKEVKANDGTSDIARQLNDARAQLAQAQEKYSPDHPDVIRLQHVIEDLEKAIAAQPASSDLTKEQAHADNPAYIQVKGQLDALMVDRKTAELKRDQLRAKLEDYERRLAGSPAVEREYRELARDLETAQLKYQQIRAKESDVLTSQNLETERKGERFTMIEPPLPPEKPISPNRFLIFGLGLVLSLGAGFGAALLADSFDQSVRGVDDVRRLLSVPPLAAIPVILTLADRKKSRRAIFYFWLGTAVVLISSAAAVHVFVRPLDVLWLRSLQRLGA